MDKNIFISNVIFIKSHQQIFYLESQFLIYNWNLYKRQYGSEYNIIVRYVFKYTGVYKHIQRLFLIFEHLAVLSWIEIHAFIISVIIEYRVCYRV